LDNVVIITKGLSMKDVRTKSRMIDSPPPCPKNVRIAPPPSADLA